MEKAMTRRPLSLPLLFVGGVALTLALALWVFYILMRPPMTDLAAMTLFLMITAVVSVAAGYSAYRLGWINRSPRLQITLLGGYLIALLLTFLNVWVTARLMFTSQHDLLLATVLLIFATGIAIALGLFFSTTLTERIRQLDHTIRCNQPSFGIGADRHESARAERHLAAITHEDVQPDRREREDEERDQDRAEEVVARHERHDAEREDEECDHHDPVLHDREQLHVRCVRGLELARLAVDHGSPSPLGEGRGEGRNAGVRDNSAIISGSVGA